MATLNEVCIPAGRVIEGVIDLTAMEEALSISSVKYNTTLQVDEDSVYKTPRLLKDAVAMVGCEITATCDMPTVLESRQYTFMQSCKDCLNTFTSNEKKAYGMNVSKPEPSAAYIAEKEQGFIQDGLVSTRKINWLGSEDYVEANLAIPALLPNYTKIDGIWTKLVALSPAAPRYTIEKNAEVTKKLQTTWTADEVLDVIDGMVELQPITLRTIVNTQKYVWLTDEMYDRLIHAMTRKSFDLCCVGTLASQVTGGVEVSVIMYGDLTLVKYSEFSAAIRDLALVGAAWNLPNRVVLALGLPIVNYTEQGSFEGEFKAVSGLYEASHSLTTALVDPYPADFYVLGY
jgi:hypothetical protein